MRTKMNAALLAALLALGACDKDDGTSGWQKATSTTTDVTSQSDSGTDAGSTITDTGGTGADAVGGDAIDATDGAVVTDAVHTDGAIDDVTTNDTAGTDGAAPGDASDTTQTDTAVPPDGSPNHCSTKEACDDQNLCTSDACIDGQCVSTPILNCAKDFMLIDVNPNDVGGIGNNVALNAYSGFLVLVAFHSAGNQAASARAGALQKILDGYIDDGESRFVVISVNVVGDNGAMSQYILGGGTPVTFPVLQDTLDDNVFGLYGAQNLDMALIDLQGGLPGIISDAWFGVEAIDPGSSVGKTALLEAIDNQLQP